MPNTLRDGAAVIVAGDAIEVVPGATRAQRVRNNLHDSGVGVHEEGVRHASTCESSQCRVVEYSTLSSE